MKKIFGLENFNVISDDENYYVFRALNKADMKDIENSVSNEISKIRTDRERWEETQGKAEYSVDSEISLEEVWDHIKIRYSKQTNCISLSSNTNVSIDYGKSYDEKYIMLKIPKSGKDGVVFAGQYMIEELIKRIDEEISKLEKDSEIYNLLTRIDGESELSAIRDEVASVFKKAKTSGKYIGTDIDLKGKVSIRDRFSRKQYFSKEQQIEYSKIIAKLTVLELYGIQKSILKTKLDNSSLIATIGVAFSSGELVHYKDIDESNDEFVTVSKEMMDIIALLQQVKDADKENSKIHQLEKIILEYINSRNTIELEITEDEFKNLTVADVYSLSEGKISYRKAIEMIKFAQNLANSRRKTIQYVDKLRDIIGGNADLSEILDRIEKSAFVIDDNIITRENSIGQKIAESVNLGLDRKLRRSVSNEEQIQIIDHIKNLSQNQLLSMSDEEIQGYILQNYLDHSKSVTENMYYAETIVEGLNLSKIYKNEIDSRNLSDEEKEVLLDKLKNVDCKRLYNAFASAGISGEDISGYIINILANGGYQKYSIEELSHLDDLDNIVLRNVNNNFLSGRVFPLILDNLLGIKDNDNMVDGTSIILRDYQQQTVDNIDRIYEDGKRFAGVVLPTGGGKSFVAITEMLKNKNGNILYFAPQTEILNQIQRHILKNVVGVEVLTAEEVEELKRKGITKAPKGKIFPDEVKSYISKEFPHLKMYCYQGMSDAEKSELREDLKNADADFIVLDELHRVGAESWEPIIKELIEKNNKANILGITATPIRDVDHRDMMKEIAIATGTYSKQEIIQKKYLASEIYLIDAIQQGLVVEPKIVSFNYSLIETDQYKEVQKMIEEEQDDSRRKELQNILNEMNQIAGTSDELAKQILELENDEEKAALQREYNTLMNLASRQENIEIGKVVNENIVKKDGRYIIFLPQNYSGLPQEQYIEEQIKRVKDILKDIDDAPEIGVLSSKKSKADNHLAISNFENSKSEHLKLIFAIDKLNEGVHIDGINGEIMLRKISGGSKILYLQQLGRVIFSLEPGVEISEDELPIVFDVYNNYLTQDMNKAVNKKSITSDLQQMRSITRWINKHQYFPDINSEEKDEARKAITLKRIKTKYTKYLDGINGKNLSETDIYEIGQILDLARSINLFEIDIPERVIPPGEKDLSEVALFRVSGSQKRFLELFKTATNITKGTRKVSDNLRISTIMSVLSTLDEYGVEINNENILVTDTIEDLLLKVPNHLQEIIREEAGVDLDYKIGEEYNNVKVAFLDTKKSRYFSDADVKELYKYGIFEPIPDEYLLTLDEEYINSLDRNVLERDFIVAGPNKLQKLNVKTGTYYDENGFDYYGRNIDYIEPKKSVKPKDEIKQSQELDKLVHVIMTINKLAKRNLFVNYDTDELHGTTAARDIARRYQKEVIRSIPTRYYIEKEIIKARQYLEGQELDVSEKIRFKKLGILPLNIDENGVDIDTGERQESLFEINDEGFDSAGLFRKKTNGRYNTMTDFSRGVGDSYNERGFDVSRLYKGKYKYDYNGYDFEGKKLVLDEHGFDDEGYYWGNEGENKEQVRSLISPAGFEKGGMYVGNFDRYKYDQARIISSLIKKGFYTSDDPYDKKRIVKIFLDPNGFDIDGYYWRINEKTGKREKTNSKVNEYGFDAHEEYCEKNENGEFISTGKKVDRNNFDINRINEKTKSEFDELGYNIDRKDIDGYNQLGINRNEIKIFLQTRLQYINQDFTSDGYYKDSLSKYSLETGYDDEGYDENGYDINGNSRPKSFEYLQNGLDQRHFSKSGYFYEFDKNTRKYRSTKKKYDNHGFKQDGTTENGGVFNERGFKFYGVHRNGTKFDDEGYDIDGYDKNGFNREGIHKLTEKMYDRNGFYANGINKDTGLNYDKRKFRIDGINVVTNSYSDVLGFTIDGRNIYTGGKRVNEKNFDQNGIFLDKYKRRHEYLPTSGLNVYGMDAKGKNRRGMLHPSVRFAKAYLQKILLKGQTREKICRELADDCNVSVKEAQLYIDFQMEIAFSGYSQMKKLLTDYVTKVQETIEKKDLELQQLLQDKSAKIEDINKNKRISENLRNRIETAKDITKFNGGER